MAIALLVLLVIMVAKVDSRDVSDLQEEVNALKSNVDLLTKRIYFMATFKTIEASCDGGKTVIFDTAVANIGNAYNPTTGVFTAPYRGDYILAYQTFPVGTADANWDFYINDQMALRGRSQTSGETSNESVLPVTLQAGDRVYVKSRLYLKFYGPSHSFFAGLLSRAF